MRRFWTLALAITPACAFAAAACTGDDEIYRDGNDAGSFETGAPAEAAPPPPPDAAPADLECGDAGGAPPRLLVTIGPEPGKGTSSELAAVNLTTNTVDGRLGFASLYGVTWSKNKEPFLLAQETDVVSRLDAREPWKVVSSWNVRGDDGVDGGLPNANPSAIAVPGCGKGYVLRFNRNRIAVIDTSEKITAGAPKSWIDLGGLVHAEDADGYVEMTSAIHVASKKRVYVLLGNVDLRKVATDGFTALCASTKPTIIAIDTETDAIVASETLTAEGYNPPLGSAFWYDAAKDRFLVLSAGCNEDDGAGGPGAIVRRRIEEVDVATGAVRTLLSLDDKGFPSALAYVDETHAAVAFFGQAFFWDPTKPTLGTEISGGMDFLASDGTGRLVGSRSTFVDGGPGPLQIVSVPLSGVGPTVLLENPFTNNAGFVSSAEVWPRP